MSTPAPTRDRYAQCDGTCTADCGACKGAGRPAPGTLTLPMTVDVAVDVDAYMREYGFTDRAEAIADATEHLCALLGEVLTDKARQMGTFTTALRQDPA